MAYDFATLSPADFEDLSSDLVGTELGIRFEVFSPGPDGGADGRHSKGDASIVLQAKHYVNSPPSVLKTRLKGELGAIERLNPARYVLATSSRLTANTKEQIKTLLGDYVQRSSDIYGPRELNALLRKYPQIEKSHIKLWLSGVPMLERILRSASHAFTKIAEDEIATKIRVFAPNPSFDHALGKLASNNVLIISGPPGVGKTTLAEILTYAFLADDWELVAIRSLDDGFQLIDDRKKQIFLFDDFLGKVALDRKALAHKDSELAKFIKRVRTSAHAKFILTTRAYIFEEARRVSEYLADGNLGVSKYVLDVGVYTRRIKARILYNHLLIAQTPLSHIGALLSSGSLKAIVDHKNYNPRVIEWMTDAARISGIEPPYYPAAFLQALANPEALWDIAFRTHISPASRHLLIALFFGSEYGLEMNELRLTFDALHAVLCAKHGVSTDPKDFEESVKVLEGGFIKIEGTRIGFVNPSLRDYLTGYLKDVPLLLECASSARKSDWARALWHYRLMVPMNGEQTRSFALAFHGIAKALTTLPTWLRVKANSGWSLYPVELCNTDRLTLLLDWWQCTGDSIFSDCALQLAAEPIEGLDPWRDGNEAIQLVAKINQGDFVDLPNQELFLESLEKEILKMLNIAMPIDDLERISDEIEHSKSLFGMDVLEAVSDAIRYQIERVDELVSDVDSESTLEDHAKSIRRLAQRANIDDPAIEVAVAAVNLQMKRLAESSSSDSSSPDIQPVRAIDRFDDEQLNGSFAPLLTRV